MGKVLEVINAEKYYGEKGNLTKALNDVSFSVEQGEFVGIMGASGSGKTTLLNCISTIDRLTGGQVLIEEKNIVGLRGEKLNQFRRDYLGFIFQDFNLLDTMTAYENIALALTIQNRKVKDLDEIIKKTAVALGIEDVLEKYPYQMSGGQKQRVACARAVVTEPKLILADEPTGALDSKASKMLLESMKTLNEEMESTILMVTHDAFTASYASRIIFIKDGKIFSEIRKDEKESRKEFFAKIIDVMSVLGGDLNELV
ncbi:MAG: ABC transporter ATP-binding protein [Eubacteriales bacterium]|nr:ABC transporter ATP-binding protein [Eubacteriales bacterium]